MKRRLVLGSLIGISLVIAMTSPLFERFFGRKRLRFPYLSQPLPAATYAELAAKPGWAKAELEVAPAVKLRGLVRRPSAKSKPWVLFYPGNDASQLERGQRFLIGLGSELDLGLAVFGYRGYDASDGKSEHDAIQADAPRLLLELCRSEGIEPKQVHLAGFSIGGHFAVHAARGAAEGGKRAATLTLLAPVNDIVMYHPGPFEKLSAGEDYQTSPLLGAVPAPVLVLQGGGDQTLEGNSQGLAIAKQLGERAKYVEFPGVGHVPLLGHAPALEAMREFLKQHVP